MAGILWAIVLQSVDLDVDLAGALGGGALAALTTLVFGAVLVARAPEYTTARMREVVGEPFDSFAWGVFVLALIVVSAALVITIVGKLVVIPLLVAAYVVWAFGSAVAFLAIADRLLDRFDDDRARDRGGDERADARGPDSA